MAFRYQAIDPSGRPVAETIEAATPQQAAELLRGRGLFITRLETVDEQQLAAAEKKTRPGGRLRDVIFFTQQMTMLLRAGSRVVQALEAIEEQTPRPAWRQVIKAVRMEVEEGKPLSSALGQFPKLFSSVFVNMVNAGEASGNLGLAFERLAHLTRQQQEVRSRVVGAFTYPAVLMALCMGAVSVLFIFVLPRFAEMFSSLDVELPLITRLMIDGSDWVGENWLLLTVLLLLAAGGTVSFLRSPAGRRGLSRAAVRVPVFGVIVRNVILARICRVWGQLLESRVGLLEAVRLTEQSTTSLDFRELLQAMAASITQGSSIGQPLRETWLMPRTFAAALITGEESGRLGESLLFVAGCLEDENTQVLSSLTRVIEPFMLVIMGLIVGGVAISLFLPMFDMATVAGG